MWDLIIFCSLKCLNLVSVIEFQYSVDWVVWEKESVFRETDIHSSELLKRVELEME